MTDEVGDGGLEPCGVCLDLHEDADGAVQSLEISGRQGCQTCSFLYTGINKSETGTPLKRTRSGPTLGGQMPGTANGPEHSEPQWKYFRTQIPNNKDKLNPETLQVFLGKSSYHNDLIDQLEFYTDSGTYFICMFVPSSNTKRK